ncbi:5'/3'-nucleotidase SurE [Clostridiales bacterium oral taxon 876 str. F0540]|nr:5'/3'-nucleotidase SurE [Clostridiales bacterium oral taxon 876 str. F0540]
MRLLLTNDDGIYAPGLYELAKELEKYHEIIIAAPDNQRSACGHSITITRPLIVKNVKLEGINSKAYSIDGTPADCVRTAVEKLVEGKIDMVVSGINKGVNLGTDVIYSGTVSAAIEAAVYNVPSIAVSSEFQGNKENYEVAAKTAANIIPIAIKNYISDDMVLNINVPLIDKDKIKGIKVCRIGNRTYSNVFIEDKDDQGNVSYEIIGSIKDRDEEDTDVKYFKQGYITLTPLHYDLTNYKIIDKVREWF